MFLLFTIVLLHNDHLMNETVAK